MVTAGRFAPETAAVIVDLDDTLYPHCDYLHGLAVEVGGVAGVLGLSGRRLTELLHAELAAGSDRGGTIDRALTNYGLSSAFRTELGPHPVAAFTTYQPAKLQPRWKSDRADAAAPLAACLGWLGQREGPAARFATGPSSRAGGATR